MSSWKTWSIRIGSICLFTILLFYGCGIKLSVRPLVIVPEETSSDDFKTDSNEYWDMIKENITSPGQAPFKVKHISTWFNNTLIDNGFTYTYGGKTVSKIQQGTSKEYPGILACYLDNNEYSGVSLVLGQNKTVNLKPVQKENASGLAFWAKGFRGDETIYVGLVDDESDGMKVQTKLSLRDFGKVDTSWNYFMIPLKKFLPKGKYWDDAKKMEVLRDVDWEKISEVRFSANKAENKVSNNDPVKFYVEQVSIIENIPGFFDADKYWETFVSNEPDLLLHDLESPADQQWTTGSGPASKVTTNYVKPEDSKYGKSSLSITYQLSDWCDVMYDYQNKFFPAAKRDWRKYWGIKFHIYSTKPFQSISIQISDAGNELYIASCGGPEGWSEVIVPFRDFYKFPYYQPANAKHNGIFDLDNVLMIDIKPSGEGSGGTFLVDDIKLTNDRSAKVEDAPREKTVAVTGSFSSVITQKVNDGIFGINAAHWDSDLLNPKTATMVKPIGHKVLRIPGGLSADEYHWKDALSKKDPTINIDEFLDFSTKINCEPMITVNFGTGTPEEAAAWVEYVNIQKKRNVRYWEVGNELYGDWHKKHCSANEYGKKAVEFINAMKKVDPSILVTVVWELESKWNDTVFQYTKTIADGVNVHNYPQEAGQENDMALLIAPQTLDNIIGNLRKQLSDYGQKGKAYQIWLTEWNSVDFNPGPQVMSIVNVLFVTDYLGMLAKNNIEQASFWAIHNNIFEQGGDYGYLSRSDFSGGPNVPYPSYWGFKIASESLRGSLVQSVSNDKKVTVYANLHENGTKTVLLINKYPKTSANITLSIPEFKGNGTISQITNNNLKEGYTTAPITIKNNMNIQLPPYSITRLQVK